MLIERNQGKQQVFAFLKCLLIGEKAAESDSLNQIDNVPPAFVGPNN